MADIQPDQRILAAVCLFFFFVFHLILFYCFFWVMGDDTAKLSRLVFAYGSGSYGSCTLWHLSILLGGIVLEKARQEIE